MVTVEDVAGTPRTFETVFADDIRPPLRRTKSWRVPPDGRGTVAIEVCELTLNEPSVYRFELYVDGEQVALVKAPLERKIESERDCRLTPSPPQRQPVKYSLRFESQPDAPHSRDRNSPSAL
jgi:hypothetical protein